MLMELAGEDTGHGAKNVISRHTPISWKQAADQRVLKHGLMVNLNVYPGRRWQMAAFIISAGVMMVTPVIAVLHTT